jgi:hypothetical protein
MRRGDVLPAINRGGPPEHGQPAADRASQRCGGSGPQCQHATSRAGQLGDRSQQASGSGGRAWINTHVPDGSAGAVAVAGGGAPGPGARADAVQRRRSPNLVRFPFHSGGRSRGWLPSRRCWCLLGSVGSESGFPSFFPFVVMEATVEHGVGHWLSDADFF